MHPFTYRTVTSLGQAVAEVRDESKFVAGGTTLVDLMKDEVERPGVLIDISRLPLRAVRLAAGDAAEIGALATMSDVAAHARLRRAYPVIAESLELSASPQLRNMATIGGNLLQRTRCTYFRDVSAPCNKREPGSGCSAVEGNNRGHAIFGGSGACVATHPSDLAVALLALDARVELQGTGERRTVPLADFLLQPGSTPQTEHALAREEIITAVRVPEHPRPLRSGYLKVRDRASYEFALVSVAVVLHVEEGVVRAARVAAGGVGTVPWRLGAVEQRLLGQPPSAALWRDAAEVAGDGAQPLSQNGFKPELLARTVRRQLSLVGGRS